MHGSGIEEYLIFEVDGNGETMVPIAVMQPATVHTGGQMNSNVRFLFVVVFISK